MSNPRNPSTISFQQYIYDCRRLIKGIDCVLEDLDFQNEGGKIRYAIDFAEIRAYVDPNSPIDDMKIFRDDGVETARAIQNVALNLLLKRKPILLAPYASELQAYIRHQQTEITEETLHHVKMARMEASRILKSPEYPKVRELVTSLRESPQDVSEEEYRIIGEYVGKNASNLLLLLQPSQVRPIHVLANLFRERPFDSLSACGIELSNLSLNEATRERWEEQLSQNRPRRIGSNYHDAYSMMLLEAVNNELSKTNTKLCLVTRSSYMHQIFEVELENGLWKSNFLRHPRSFITPQPRGSEDLQETKKRLEDLRRSIQVCLDTTLVAGIHPVNPDSIWAPLNEMVRRNREEAEGKLEDIKREWRTLISFVVADSGSQDRLLRTNTDHNLNRGIILELFRVVNGRNMLRTYVHDRIREVAATITHDYRYLVWISQISHLG